MQKWTTLTNCISVTFNGTIFCFKFNFHSPSDVVSERFNQRLGNVCLAPCSLLSWPHTDIRQHKVHIGEAPLIPSTTWREWEPHPTTYYVHPLSRHYREHPDELHHVGTGTVLPRTIKPRNANKWKRQQRILMCQSLPSWTHTLPTWSAKRPALCATSYSLFVHQLSGSHQSSPLFHLSPAHLLFWNLLL